MATIPSTYNSPLRTNAAATTACLSPNTLLQALKQCILGFYQSAWTMGGITTFVIGQCISN